MVTTLQKLKMIAEFAFVLFLMGMVAAIAMMFWAIALFNTLASIFV